MNFSELNLPNQIQKAVSEMGYTEATEIQAKSIPLILSGVDVIGRSQTGTGKTAAFGLPTIAKITGSRSVEALILCPTRELAMQACDEIKKFSKYMDWVRPCAVYGGANILNQIRDLKKGANIVIGTPGRVMDHIERRTLKLENVKTMILDEADEMLNMGFREDIEEILKSVPQERQTILFSATMPPAIMAITKNYQNDPEVVEVAAKAKTVDAIEQYFYEVPSGRKTDALMMLLSMYDFSLSIVFCNTKKMVDDLVSELSAKGFKVSGIHGDMKQQQRTQVMESFKSGRTNILVATDVAARGIDVSGVDAVLNYDIPQDYEYYIHRIGRTGRAGKTGVSFTLTSGRKQFYEMRDLQRYIKAEIKQGDLPSSEQIKNAKLEKLASKIRTQIENTELSEYSELIDTLTNDGTTERDLCAALLSMQVSRQLKTIKNIPEIVIPKALKNERKPKGDGADSKPSSRVKLFISAGKQQRLAPNFILGALVEATGLKGKSFGKIEISERFSTVEIPESEKAEILTAVDGMKINGIKVQAKLLEGKAREKDNREKSDNRRGDSRRPNRFDNKHRGSQKGGQRGYKAQNRRPKTNKGSKSNNANKQNSKNR